MRIFNGLCEAYNEIQRDLLEVGSWVKGYSYQDKVVSNNPEFDFMELSPYLYAITDTKDMLEFVESENLYRDWIQDELFERISNGGNPGEAWKKRPEVWEEFIGPDGKFSYTYGERLAEGDQIKRIIQELKIHPHSRQCVMNIFMAERDLFWMGGVKRIPCSLNYHFMIREGRLDLHYMMRSCDIFTHFPYDMVLALRLRKYIAHTIEVPCGNFTHYITSLHGFRKDFPPGLF